MFRGVMMLPLVVTSEGQDRTGNVENGRGLCLSGLRQDSFFQLSVASPTAGRGDMQKL